MKPTKPVLVLGGGIAGLTAAEELARNELPVLLLEKEGQLGGHGARWACMATEQCQKCSTCLVMDVKQRVMENQLIQIHTQGSLDGITMGENDVRVSVAPIPLNASDNSVESETTDGEVLREATDWEVDAVFVATGFETFPARQKPMLHYDEFNAVITTEDLNRVIREDRIESLPIEGHTRPRLAFLQCVGSRDREAGRDYCSQVCCKTSLRLAARLLHKRPEWDITLFYIDLQVFGKGFREFYRSLRGRIRLVQGVPSEVLPAEDHSVALVFEDQNSGELITEEFGLVVLATGMLPSPNTQELSGLLQIPLGKGGFLQKVRGGNGSRLYTLGACRAPMDIVGARRQALEAVGDYLVKRGLTTRKADPNNGDGVNQ